MRAQHPDGAWEHWAQEAESDPRVQEGPLGIASRADCYIGSPAVRTLPSTMPRAAQQTNHD